MAGFIGLRWDLLRGPAGASRRVARLFTGGAAYEWTVKRCLVDASMFMLVEIWETDLDVVAVVRGSFASERDAMARGAERAAHIFAGGL